MKSSTDSLPIGRVHNATGNLYLADDRNVRVYKFDSRGKPVAQFLSKGQGPGEFPRFGDLQIIDNYVWIIGTWPMKIAKFALDGQYVGSAEKFIISQ